MEKTHFVHRTATFERKLEELRSIGGHASMAAGKADELICLITNEKGDDLRVQFRFTRHGENRIKHCQKYDLGCGYRLVFIRRGRHIVLLYVGSHDDCFRWIEGNRGMTCEVDRANHAIKVLGHSSAGGDYSPGDGIANDCRIDEYEAQLMNRINEKILRRIFSGFAKNQVTDAG